MPNAQDGLGGFTPNARVVFESRYLLRNAHGELNETIPELFRRVAKTVASAETRGRRLWAERFEELMISRRFLPNSPTLMNAGKPRGQLSACYVLPLKDELGPIFDSLKEAALIHQSGGGTGFSFSRLRPHGTSVGSTAGAASGPVSFMRIFDAMTEQIKQGGARRGANMAILRIDHPDVLEFIEAKSDGRALPNFNLSVGITDEFMMAVHRNTPFSLRDPRTRGVVRELSAVGLFQALTRAAWNCGDPGVVFLDRINQFNPTPNEGEIESTNPCGEQPLLAHESCNLGSLNLSLYVEGQSFDWPRLAADIGLAVRFLDNVIDVNHYPVEDCRRITHKNRKIGLGVMGWADSLLMLGLPYGSQHSLLLGERVMSFVDRTAKRVSAELAREKGAFPNWKNSLWRRLGYPRLRNATVSTVAPTGTISILAGCSSGIEPIFSGFYSRNVLSGKKLKETHPAVESALAQAGASAAGIEEKDLPGLLGAAWTPAYLVSVDGHVQMQSRFQHHSDSAVSKTINLPQSASEEEVRRAYLSAYASGCKGITIYRDQSRSEQVLEAGRACETCVN